MRIGLLYNPISGKGRGRELALAAGALLEQAAFTVIYFESQPSYSDQQAKKILSQLDAIVICGGDGTLKPLLPQLAASGTPVAMLASGVENLFARHFRMAPDCHLLTQILTRAREWQNRKLQNRDLQNPESQNPELRYSDSPSGEDNPNWWSEHRFGMINDTPFFTMISIGFDACVVHAISQKRTSAIGHWGYMLPTLRTWRGHSSPQLSVKVDNRPWINGESGYLIIANTSQYALRVPWVPEASSASLTLAARFFPYKTATDFLQLAVTLKRQGSDALNADTPVNLVRESTESAASKNRGNKFITGERFQIATDGPSTQYPVQADGDFAAFTPVTVKRAENCIRVINFPC